MLKLKKNLSREEIKALYKEGAKFTHNFYNNEEGCSTMGYIERRGLTIEYNFEIAEYQVIYSSRAHGQRATQDIINLSGNTYKEKYNQYKNQVSEDFYKLLEGN